MQRGSLSRSITRQPETNCRTGCWIRFSLCRPPILRSPRYQISRILPIWNRSREADGRSLHVQPCSSHGNGFRVRAISQGQAKSHMDSLKEMKFYCSLLVRNTRGRWTARTMVFSPRALLDVWNTNGSKTYAQLMKGISQKLTEQNIDSSPVMVRIPKTSALGE